MEIIEEIKERIEIDKTTKTTTTVINKIIKVLDLRVGEERNQNTNS